MAGIRARRVVLGLRKVKTRCGNSRGVQSAENLAAGELSFIWHIGSRHTNRFLAESLRQRIGGA